MRKITLKKLITLVLCIGAFQTYAQVSFQENTFYRLRTVLESPEDYNTSKDAPFPDQFVYPTAASGSNSLKLELKDTNNDNQLFAFVALPGQMAEYPVGSGVMYQVYNISSFVDTGGSNGTGALELNQLGQNSQRMRLRGNAIPFDDDLAKFIVVVESSTASETYFQIIASATIGASTAANRAPMPDTNYEFFNFHDVDLGDLTGPRPRIEQWVFENAAGQTVLSNKQFDTSSIFIANPIKNTLSITGITDSVNQVSIYSIVGQEMLTNKVDASSSLNIDVSGLTSGIYLVTLKGDTGSLTKKIIKE
ncbi:T9SS type A sorting domain-containing protein [Hyunsoonleella sp. 2307UL5-6]|uniref:T9SS type A sorting domain-containing protein n=1 Tax=Hyunsoonleella sp. 2307UL5-6 TaxID=3384768 RepID=UPI0039BCFD11